MRNVFPFFVDFIFQTKKNKPQDINAQRYILRCRPLGADDMNFYRQRKNKTTQATSMNIVFFILSKEEHIVSFSH